MSQASAPQTPLLQHFRHRAIRNALRCNPAQGIALATFKQHLLSLVRAENN